MPDFTADLGPGLTPAIWTDPATGAAASRLNDLPGKPRRYWKIIPPVLPGTVVVELEATVNGVEAPLDGALGGRLFIVSWVKWSGPSPPPLVQVPGQSSVANATLDAAHVGFFQVLFWRPAGGAVLVSFNVES